MPDPEFIDIKSTGEDERVSCFEVTDHGLRVVGNLPHGYEFRMKTLKDGEKLAAWLNEQRQTSTYIIPANVPEGTVITAEEDKEGA
jgi:hypothetical protein